MCIFAYLIYLPYIIIISHHKLLSIVDCDYMELAECFFIENT